MLRNSKQNIAIALIAMMAILVAAFLISRGSGESNLPQTTQPIIPTRTNLRAADFLVQTDGRFDPKGFGLSFSYPAGFSEYLSPIPERSKDDRTLGIEERRRHFIFADGDAKASGKRDLPLMRIIRITYSKPYDSASLAEFRRSIERSEKKADPKHAVGFSKLQIAGQPAIKQPVKTARRGQGTGSNYYIAANGKLYQIITFATRRQSADLKRLESAFLSSADFSD